MASEPKRGCGYRKVGGLYLFGGGIGIPCDRLPFELTVCSCCGQGIKQARGWTWVDVAKLFQGAHLVDTGLQILPCKCSSVCPLCKAPETLGRAGLLWIGEKFYRTPAQFVAEGVNMGFSRRIKAIPQGFKVGETWVLLAHKNAIPISKGLEPGAPDFKPGIFYCWRPERVEKIMLESTRGTEEIEALEKRGITPVFVPDGDKDHLGNVHDDLDNEKREEAAE
jgi:hypothetical protein